MLPCLLLVFAAIRCSCTSGPTAYSVIGDAGWQSLESHSVGGGCDWHVHSSNGSVTVPATVPGQIHLDLQRAGVINDTYYRFNAETNMWVRYTSWTFETNFTLSKDLADLVAAGPEEGEVWLVFDEIDTIAHVAVNEPVHDLPEPYPNPVECFVKHNGTLPVARGSFFYGFQMRRQACAEFCVRDHNCAGFAMELNSGPYSSSCGLYHSPSAMPTSNASGDWYARSSTPSRCQHKSPPSAGNQFLRYSFPVLKKLRAGGGPHGVHTLKVQIQSLGYLDQQGGSVAPGYVKWTPVRKEPSNFGIDWAPTTETMGIALPVYLVGQARLVLLDFVATVVGVPSNPATMLTPDTAHFKVSIEVRINLTARSNITYKIDGSWSAGSIVVDSLVLPAGVSTITSVLNVSGSDVELWWPAGVGKQRLYQVKFAVGVNFIGRKMVSTSRRIGFRTVNLKAELGNATNPIPPVQQYRVNGVSIFAKGANWIPPDSFEARATRDTLCSQLQSARDANMNFLRIWGGGLYPQDEFFDCADELGILLQQDGIFANAMYSTEPEFLRLVAREFQYQARRLASHPSLFHWSGNNEIAPDVTGGWWDRVFQDTVFPNITAVDKSRPLWPACPALPWVSGVDSGGLPDGNPFVAVRGASGPPAESHSYWFDLCQDLSSCRNCVDDSFYPNTVFASEYGWVSPGSLESLIPILDEDDYTLMSSAMQYHYKGSLKQTQVYNMVRWNFGNFSSPYVDRKDVASFRRALHMAMVTQADCIRAETEHYRRGRDLDAQTGGALYWMLNDNWPGGSWSSLEYGGRRKLLHYEAMRFYNNVAMSSYCLPTIENCQSVNIHITSDLMEPLPIGTFITASLTRWADGVSTTVLSVAVGLGPRSGSSITLEKMSLSAGLELAGCLSVADCFLTTRLLQGGAPGIGEHLLAPDNHQWLTLWRDAKLQAAELRIKPESTDTDGRVVLTITSDKVAPVVMVHCAEPSDYGWFDDNGLLMMPGKPIRLTYTPRAKPEVFKEHRPCTASNDGFYATSINGASASISSLRKTSGDVHGSYKQLFL